MRFAFRGRSAADREEAAAEAVAAAYASYVSLKARGKDPVRDFPSALAAYAVLHVKAGRQMGSRNSTTDALSPLAQRKRGFRVESLHMSSGVAPRPPPFDDRSAAAGRVRRTFEGQHPLGRAGPGGVSDRLPGIPGRPGTPGPYPGPVPGAGQFRPGRGRPVRVVRGPRFSIAASVAGVVVPVPGRSRGLSPVSRKLAVDRVREELGPRLGKKARLFFGRGHG